MSSLPSHRSHRCIPCKLASPAAAPIPCLLCLKLLLLSDQGLLPQLMLPSISWPAPLASHGCLQLLIWSPCACPNRLSEGCISYHWSILWDRRPFISLYVAYLWPLARSLKFASPYGISGEGFLDSGFIRSAAIFFFFCTASYALPCSSRSLLSETPVNSFLYL